MDSITQQLVALDQGEEPGPSPAPSPAPMRHRQKSHLIKIVEIVRAEKDFRPARSLRAAGPAPAKLLPEITGALMAAVAVPVDCLFR
ncbi:hypothetical protein JZ751_029918, partial [Albula glossodonta]